MICQLCHIWGFPSKNPNYQISVNKIHSRTWRLTLQGRRIYPEAVPNFNGQKGIRIRCPNTVGRRRRSFRIPFEDSRRRLRPASANLSLSQSVLLLYFDFSLDVHTCLLFCRFWVLQKVYPGIRATDTRSLWLWKFRTEFLWSNCWWLHLMKCSELLIRSALTWKNRWP